jgi:hypothetical protein
MFNLLVAGRGWADGRDSIIVERLFEYTDAEVTARFKPGGQIDLRALAALPALLLAESDGTPDQIARLATITKARLSGRDVILEYTFDPDVPPITNTALETLANDLDIQKFEFSRTHWAVKDVDLFRVLLRVAQPRRARPRVFTLTEPERIEPELVSVMMPFHPGFDTVYAALKDIATAAHMRCRRADDIWENPAVIQDVVSLIDRSAVVICDCTGRNPNVFYEIGIAHTLGRDVILITQSDSDIPFDLRHLRYVPYLNNGEGLRTLAEKLTPRLTARLGH